MKILFSPSEAKFSGGKNLKIEKNSFLFPELFKKRIEFVEIYNNYLQNATKQELMKLFGTKKEDLIERYKIDIFKAPIKRVVERYDGVAYDYLDLKSLNDHQKSYIYDNVIIFSNLFGPLLAGDFGIPEYKLKQGEKIADKAPESFYKKYFSKALDDYLSNEEYLDLRAGFYDKFYKPNSPHTTLKFIKNGKVVSHWAKAYRGLVLRLIAINNIKNIEEFMDMEIENLYIKDIMKKGYHTQIIYEIR